MSNYVLKYGLIAGLVAGVPMCVMTVAGEGDRPLAYAMLVGYLTMLVAFSAVFVAVKRRRDRDLGGVIRFWPALGLGLAISAIAAAIYVIAWEAALAITGMDFAGEYAKAVIAEKQAAGASAEALAQLRASMEEFRVQYANPLYRLPMTFAEIFPVGLLVSLVTAALLRNPRFMAARTE